MNHDKVSIKTKNNFSKKKLMSRTPSPYGDTDDMSFCNKVKLSILHFVTGYLFIHMHEMS